MRKKVSDGGCSELGPVQVTVEVLPAAQRRPFAQLPAGICIRAWLLLVALLAAAGACTIVLTSESTRPSRAAARAPGTPARPNAADDAVLRRFGMRMRCPRLSVVSADGTYARVDFERFTPCGTYGNYATIILHRVRGAWVREFEITGWTCPTGGLPPPVSADLGLCAPHGR